MDINHKVLHLNHMLKFFLLHSKHRDDRGDESSPYRAWILFIMRRQKSPQCNIFSINLMTLKPFEFTSSIVPLNSDINKHLPGTKSLQKSFRNLVTGAPSNILVFLKIAFINDCTQLVNALPFNFTKVYFTVWYFAFWKNDFSHTRYLAESHIHWRMSI